MSHIGRSRPVIWRSSQWTALYRENFGYSDIEAQTPTTSDTQYYIDSLTKAFTAAALRSLVDEGKISWDTTIRDVLGSDFHYSDTTLTQHMTVTDLPSHRMGLQRSNQLWYGNDNTRLLDKGLITPHVQYLKFPHPREKLYKLDFVTAKDGSVGSLLWAHDADGPPEEFFRAGRGAGRFAEGWKPSTA